LCEGELHVTGHPELCEGDYVVEAAVDLLLKPNVKCQRLGRCVIGQVLEESGHILSMLPVQIGVPVNEVFTACWQFVQNGQSALFKAVPFILHRANGPVFLAQRKVSELLGCAKLAEIKAIESDLGL